MYTCVCVCFTELCNAYGESEYDQLSQFSLSDMEQTEETTTSRHSLPTASKENKVTSP